jgi:putative FmdB family regulatory protein
MPVYDFVCEGCGPFEQWRPVRDPAADCPSCSGPARRRFTPPGVRRMGAPLRAARDREERSASAPEVVSRPTWRPLHLGHHH